MARANKQIVSRDHLKLCEKLSRQLDEDLKKPLPNVEMSETEKERLNGPIGSRLPYRQK